MTAKYVTLILNQPTSVVFQQDFDGLDYFGRFFFTGLRPAPDCRMRPTSTS
jgi:hypothetical protein